MTTSGAPMPATPGPASPPPSPSVDNQGMTIVARTQAQLVRRRFVRHRAAMVSLVLFVLVLLLSFSATGIGPVPGWWKHDYTAIGAVADGGHPTLSVVPGFLGGDGIHLGEHPFGQDNRGTDYFALTMRGTQISLMISLVVGAVGTVVGVVIGAAAGYFRGWVEAVLMRFTDMIIVLPLLAIVSVIANRVGNAGPFWLGVVIALFTWTGLARLVRGEFLALREKEFVEAARATGTPAWRIIRKHILPNVVGVIVVSATLSVAGAVLLETALSFLGFGVKPPDTSLGRLISDYQDAFGSRPWLFFWPGVFIVLIALSVNFVGDGLRDAFDPRQTTVRK